MKRVIYKTLTLFLFSLLFFTISVSAQDYVRLKVTTSDNIDWHIDAVKAANDNGAQLPGPLSGELAIAYDGVTEPSDNDTWTEFGAYACDSIVNPDEIAGKIAYISRGACIFSGKMLNAQKAGAIAVIVANRAPIGLTVGTHESGAITMGATQPESDSVTIPAIFISYEDRVELEKLMEEGPVEVTFETPAMYDATGPDAYMTPIDQVKPLDIKVVTFTRGGSDTLYNVVFNVEITDPSNNTTPFSTTVDTLLPGKDWSTGTINEPIVEFDEAEYTPSEIGTYTMVFTATTEAGDNELDATTVTKTFEVTDYTFALDKMPVADEDGYQANPVAYLEATGIFDMGALYRTGANGGVATHASFAVANPGALDIGNGFEFTVNIYNVDLVDSNGDPMPDGLPDSDIGDPIGTGIYSIDGTEVPNQLMHVAFDSPVSLDANGLYLVMVESGGFQFTDVIPAYTTAGGEVYPGRSTVVRVGEVFRTSGFEFWNGGASDDGGSDTYPYGGRQAVVRLQMEGFVPPVSVDLLPEGSVEVFPTLTKDQVNIQFGLTENTSDLQMIVVSTEGRMMHMQEYSNVMNETIQLDVSRYAAGTYYISIKTNKGVRTEKFVVVK